MMDPIEQLCTCIFRKKIKKGERHKIHFRYVCMYKLIAIKRA